MATEKLPANLRLLDNGDFVIRNVVLSYPHLFEKWDSKGDEKKARYSATGILDKDEHKEEIDYLNARLTEMQKTKWKKRLPAAMLALRDGDPTNKDEYQGKMILVCSDKKLEPILKSRDGKREVREKDDLLYAGAKVNIRFNFWIQDNEHGQRVNASLVGVQFMDHGEKFSTINRVSDDEAFDDEGGDASDDGFGD